MKGKNQEGYSDPTASMAVGAVFKEEHETDKRAYDVDKVVEQLEKYRNTDFADGWELIITDLIEIVKAGGVDGISRKRA